MRILAVILLLAIAVSGCSNKGKAHRALEQSGYTDIRLTGWQFFGCSDKDFFSDGFTATGPSGHEAKGVVCSGWFKGATIRLD